MNPSAKTVRVLLVEDSPSDAMIVREALSEAPGFQFVITHVERLADALTQLAEQDFDIVLVDLALPDSSGLETFIRVQSADSKIPIVVLSGYSDGSVALKAVGAGAQDYLVKGDWEERVLPRAIRYAIERKRNAEALRLTHVQLRLLLDHSPAVLMAWRLDGEQFVPHLVSENITRLLGFSVPEVLDSSWWRDHVHPGDLASATAGILSSRGSDRCQMEYRLRHKDGAYHWVDDNRRLVCDSTGQAMEQVGIWTDITERRRSEEKLNASETRYRSLVDATAQIAWVTDADGQVREPLPSWQKYTGQTAEEVFGAGWATALHPEDIEGALWAWRGAVRTNTNCDVEYRLRRHDGEYRDFAVRGVPVLSKDGVLIEWVGCCRDITERKLAEAALRVALERLQLAVKTGRAGTWDVDLLTGEADWDEQMCALYGRDANDLEPGSERWHLAIHPDDLEHAAAIQTASVRGEQDAFELDFRITRRNDGAERIIRALGVTVRDNLNRPVRMTGINWDVTEERVREEKLVTALALERELTEKARTAERAKSAFLAGMSHEIRTPMNAILGFSDLISRAPDLPADCRTYIETVTTSGEALLRILNDVLDYSRLEANGLQIEESSYSPREVLQDIHTLLAPTGKAKGLDFQLDISDAVPLIQWNDAGRLRQVLLNLASNAMKFTEKGNITLGACLGDPPMAGQLPCIEYFVRDSGPGIPADNLGEIFEPFQQLDSSISRRYGGSGLGLSISRNLVNLMGGTLSVKSVIDVGSEFRVRLWNIAPKVSKASIAVTPPAETLNITFAVKNPMRLLLVEDDPISRRLMQVMLGKLGYAPLIAVNGCEAVESFRREELDCILMDLQMPLKDGFAATAEIRESERVNSSARHVYISALTANVAAHDQQRCFDAGMDAYLAKPIMWVTLAEILARAANFTRQRTLPILPALEYSRN